jgi:hypothetical protein
MGRGRPGGNPDFGEKIKFDRKLEEKCDQLVAFKVTKAMNEELSKIDNKADFLREILKEALERRKLNS